ncbi:MAG: tRNA uridine-5-carboxymethylaminomethyl(34) synthesis enzyme MnmG [Proteobacteria bacterium]|nr:tRNA uridine-5-carboxymethylaminomethyl(34) synthesis enzyme MnmG [Pseudomonadota bacterium]
MSSSEQNYDVIVIGAGHAGCEAALAASGMGVRVLVLCGNVDTVGWMPCSPSVGGTGKGQLVKEIDALGGFMARVADKTAIQHRTLNTRKGPAVQSSRTQNDKLLYHKEMLGLLAHRENLDLKQALVAKLLIEAGRVRGVEDQTGFHHQAPFVILATGTFLSGLVHIGHTSIQAGRAGEFASYALAVQLRDLGFIMGRMKTGTPARLDKRTIDFSCFTPHPGEESPRALSLYTTGIPLPQVPSYLGRTSERTHEIVRQNLERSALYGGVVKGIPARYCPSLEDKVVKFRERDSHQVILEPEGLDSHEIYASGLGNSLPVNIQTELVRSVRGLDEAEIIRPAYAIEYDYLLPTQLLSTLETKKVAGLFSAGQINGTSGYEEAAAQGMWAGINAACRVQGRPPFFLSRSEAYMGVLVDDLVTRGTSEPYRMFTSRAEYRLLLREDNADLRLMGHGFELGLVDREALDAMEERGRHCQKEIQRISARIIKPGPEVNDYLRDRKTAPLEMATPLSQLLKRTELDYRAVKALAPPPEPLNPRVEQQVEIEVKYEGYIARQIRQVEGFRDLEQRVIPEDFDYASVHGLSNELKEKLAELRPRSVGQASRMEGITPAALWALAISIKAGRRAGSGAGQEPAL